jgi:Zn-finger nucleic acid-binding protein
MKCPAHPDETSITTGRSNVEIDHRTESRGFSFDRGELDKARQETDALLECRRESLLREPDDR